MGLDRKFTITIIEDRCKGCELCVIYCPTDALEMSEKTNLNGYYIPKIKDIDKCKGCQLCFKLCPDFAIYCSGKN